MQYKSVVALALASGVCAAPNWGPGAGCSNNACLAAVTGKAALGDDSIRASHCSSYLATTVTPIETATVTLTGDSWDNNWKRSTVAVCINEVPNYASACDDAGYTSACACYGYTDVKTVTIAPSTTTKTIWVKPTGGASTCSSYTKTVTATSTLVSGTTCPAVKTSTVTQSGSWGTATTVTVTVPAATSTGGVIPSKCNVDAAHATTLVNNFVTLLEYTSYAGAQGAPGRGYKKDVSDATLATDFIDISDSINFMGGFPLGSITFPNKAAFDYGQGTQQPEVAVSVLNIWVGCNTVTWRWRITSTRYPVNGINHMEINADGLVQKNYAEFDNGAWLQSFGQQCAIKNVTTASSVATKRFATLEY